MATWDDIRKAALRLPEVTEEGRAYKVRGKLLAWERPLRDTDLRALGSAAPTSPIVGIRTIDVAAREELIAALPDVFFTIPHFGGYSAVLARLGPLPVDVVEQLVLEVWLTKAPKRVVKSYLAENPT